MAKILLNEVLYILQLQTTRAPICSSDDDPSSAITSQGMTLLQHFKDSRSIVPRVEFFSADIDRFARIVNNERRRFYTPRVVALEARRSAVLPTSLRHRK